MFESINQNLGGYILLIIIIGYIINKYLQRKWSRQDTIQHKQYLENLEIKLRLERERVAFEVELKREEAAKTVRKEAEKIAQKVKNELDIFREQQLSLMNRSDIMVNKINSQIETIKNIDEKVVTVEVAEEHKEEVISAIEEKKKVIVNS